MFVVALPIGLVFVVKAVVSPFGPEYMLVSLPCINFEDYCHSKLIKYVDAGRYLEFSRQASHLRQDGSRSIF
jgi:hypothetical protein